jgi:hypothetical protein
MIFLDSMNRHTVIDCIGRQNYGTAYVAQKYAVIGVLPSAATALAALVTGVAKTTLSVIYPEYTYYNAFAGRNVSYKEDARDLGVLFLNNIWNILSLGFLNSSLFHVTVCEELFAFRLEFLESPVPGAGDDFEFAFDQLTIHENAGAFLGAISKIPSRAINNCFSNRVSSQPPFKRVNNNTYKQLFTIIKDATIKSNTWTKAPRIRQVGGNHRVLGIEYTASEEKIKNVYRKFCRKYHTDKIIKKTGESPEAFLKRQTAARNKFVKIQNAYEALMMG